MALALHYPLAPWLATALLGIGIALAFARPHAWLIALPALLPVAAFAPWTGWIAFEEFDLLVLGVAAGGYARLALARGASQRERGVGALAGLMLGAFAASVVLAAARGVADAGGLRWGWYQGYHEPLNSLRLAKPFFWALLLWPLWRAACRVSASRASEHLSLGLMLGLAAAALAALWERLAFTGLLNFSTEYRTTALFWEMHVGGAALDGFFALTLPFAVREMLAATSRRRWCVAAAAVLLGGYACLTTFSRGLYLALPLGIGVLLWLQAAQQRRLEAASHGGRGARNYALRWALLLLAGFGAAAAWTFPGSGYRGLLALLGALLVLIPLAEPLRRTGPARWVLGLGAGVVLSGLAVAVAWIVPKGAYVAYALAGVFSVAMLALLRIRRGTDGGNDAATAAIAPLALAGYVAMLAGIALVAQHWGDATGLRRALPVSAALFALLLVAGQRNVPAWPASLRWQGSVLGVMVMIAGLVGVFGGGSYMTDRFAGDTKPLGGRLHNWRLGLAMLTTPLDWAFGKGLGRFPANYALAMTGTDMRPGDYRLAHDANGQHLLLSGGTHPLGWLELLRVSQRIASPPVPLTVGVSVRSARPVNLRFEVCEKHLLYSERCLLQSVRATPQPGQWQRLRFELEGNRPSRGAWYAPKLIVFSVGLADNGALAEIDHIELAGPDGTNLLANGDFDDGLAHWLFTSDGYHTPWHIEGIFMNALFDQGMVGALLLALIVAGALWRLAFGSARNHALAPALAAALAGFLVVGVFSSVTDVPRLAFLFYFALLLSSSLRAPVTAPR